MCSASPGVVISRGRANNMDSIPQFNSTRHYLSSLCKRNHDWHGTGQSLRLVSDRTCLQCALERQKTTAKARSKKRFAKRIAITNKIKLERGCADCGYKAHPAALQFDHLPGTKKLAGVAYLTFSAPAKKLLEEIDKCEVVCANCHAIRTAKRRNG